MFTRIMEESVQLRQQAIEAGYADNWQEAERLLELAELAEEQAKDMASEG